MKPLNRESPSLHKDTPQFTIHDEATNEASSGKQTGGTNSKNFKTNNSGGQDVAPKPLSTSMNINKNQKPSIIPRSKPSNVRGGSKNFSYGFEFGQGLTNRQSKENFAETKQEDFSSMDELLAQLSTLGTSDNPPSAPTGRGANDTSEHDHGETFTKKKSDAPVMDAADFIQMKKELQDARSKIAEMDQELSQHRTTKQTTEQTMKTGVNMSLKLQEGNDHSSTRSNKVSSHNFSTGDSTSDNSGGTSYKQFDRPQRSIWGNDGGTGNLPFGSDVWNQQPTTLNGWNSPAAQGFGGTPMFGGNPSAPQPHRPINLRMDNFDNSPPYLQDIGSAPYDQGFRRPHLPSSRAPSAMGQVMGSWNSYPPSVAPTPAFSPSVTPMPFNPMTAMNHGPMNYQPRPIGTTLSPTAMEFNASHMMNGFGMQGNPWNAQPSMDSASSYVSGGEPMNYRRMLERNINCDWKYLVEKVICSNDQQASIFMQQKLKIAHGEQKLELLEAIITQCYPLMVNRFGNFLVQRCFEHGSPEQVIAIANTIRGNTLNLSMDPFGCHVVQKAFDVVPEDYKAIMVHELLRRIPETVVHRYACHVWQKLFELRWSDSPPQIMKYVNEALRGMWHEVALGETGSLVVQNIFENCLEEDKRPAINEVLANIDVIAHGQYGNWCIQHICEHGAPADKSRAIEHVLRFANEYSTDQYASKVVEKCLKTAGPEFLDRYLEKICEGRPDRPRMPLIDISSDQYGNYLIQHILMTASPQHRELVKSHVSKHMVSLRGSKFGSRVAMLCSNPAYQTHPGAPIGMQMNYRFPPNMRLNRQPMGGMGMGMGMNGGMPYR